MKHNQAMVLKHNYNEQCVCVTPIRWGGKEQAILVMLVCAYILDNFPSTVLNT